MEQPPWEPPIAGSESEALLGALDRLRATFRYKCADLDETGLRTRLGTSTLTLGGLLKHLAAAEDYYSTSRLDGSSMPEVWRERGWDDSNEWEFRSAATDSASDLYAWYDGAVADARARQRRAAATIGMGGSVEAAFADGSHANLRRLVCDLLEEYGRHTGHADLIRESIDGRVGEDPEEGWPLPW